MRIVCIRWPKYKMVVPFIKSCFDSNSNYIRYKHFPPDIVRRLRYILIKGVNKPQLQGDSHRTLCTFAVLCTATTWNGGLFLVYLFELEAGVRYLAWASSTHFEQTETIVKFEGKILIQFYWTLSSGSRSLLLKFSIMILDRFLD